MYISSIDLDLLLWSAQNCKKLHFFRQFEDHNSRWEHQNWTNHAIFYLLFPLKLFVTFIFEFENIQNSFSFVPAFGPF